MIKKIILILLVIFSGIFYYRLTGQIVCGEFDTKVVRIIDGDTIEADFGKIRLKGINTPEKSMWFYEESKIFLKNLIENETIEIESYGYDKYGRVLAYVFHDGKNINEEILKRGFGALYYYEKDGHYEGLKKAEEFARINELGIWKKSSDSGCLEILELKYKEDTKRCSNEEMLVLKNNCNKEISVLIKDDATHIYREKIKANSLFSKNFSCVWNDDGDSVFVWDEKGILIFYRYSP